MTPAEILERAVDQHKPVAVFAAFSGGHDSLTSTALAMETGLVTSVLHINTGIGIEETREFVRATCQTQDWPLLELHPPDGHTYRQIVLEHGFPGPGGHRYIYVRLKERAIQELHASYREKRGDKILIITGVRSAESTRRMGRVEPIAEDTRRRVWVAPIHDWSKADCNAFITDRGLARNEVVDHLHMSGECLCGSFARPGEMSLIEFFYPATAQAIHDLEHEVQDRGLPWVWGAKPPMKGQGELELAGLCAKCTLAHEEAPTGAGA
jgi:3'-phosphoadenosine 5'-phosphosulfate sulfotransferase (PAPS reductase)/FAD synthetase